MKLHFFYLAVEAGEKTCNKYSPVLLVISIKYDKGETPTKIKDLANSDYLIVELEFVLVRCCGISYTIGFTLMLNQTNSWK